MTDPTLPAILVPPAITPGTQRYACIDVGTNSVKMVVADLAPAVALRIYDFSVNTRLGEGMQANGGRLREVAMRRSLNAISDFADDAKMFNAMQVVAVGTAALRDAENRSEFVQRVRERCGVTVEVIAGEEEARLSYLAVRRDPQWRPCERLLVIDVGGGSTEVIEGEPGGERIAARLSVNWGAVRLTESFLRSDPPTITQLQAASEAAREGFARVPLTEQAVHGQGTTCVVGVGGTLTNLAAMQAGGKGIAESLHGTTLHGDQLEDLIALLAARSVEERKTLPGLDPRRADIILGGAILLSESLARIGSPGVDVSTRGLRWGVLYDRFL